MCTVFYASLVIVYHFIGEKNHFIACCPIDHEKNIRKLFMFIHVFLTSCFTELNYCNCPPISPVFQEDRDTIHK